MTSIIRSAVGSQPSLGFIKFLKENNIDVIGTDVSNAAVGKFLVSKFFEVPYASDESNVISRYLDISKKTGSNFIISGPEEEIIVLSKYRKDFEEAKINIFHPPIDTLKIVTDKKILHDSLSNFGINTPRVTSLKDIDSIQTNKAVIKPRLGRGSAGVIIGSKDKISEKAKEYDDSKYIAQEFLSGKEYTVDVFCDMQGNWLNIVPRIRLKTDSGISVIGQTVNNKKIIDETIKVLENFKFYGGNCFQFIENSEEIPHLTDINPRFGGGSILSIKSSASFQSNIINILNNKNTIKGSLQFNKMTMYRGYEEFYSD